MIAVIFEVWPAEGKTDAYLDMAAKLRPHLEEVEGFISVERFRSLMDPEKLLSISIWENEAALARWRAVHMHRTAQRMGREVMFADYRLRVAGVIRDYGMTEREEAPADSREANG